MEVHRTIPFLCPCGQKTGNDTSRPDYTEIPNLTEASPKLYGEELNFHEVDDWSGIMHCYELGFVNASISERMRPPPDKTSLCNQRSTITKMPIPRSNGFSFPEIGIPIVGTIPLPKELSSVYVLLISFLGVVSECQSLPASPASQSTTHTKNRPSIHLPDSLTPSLDFWKSVRCCHAPRETESRIATPVISFSPGSPPDQIIACPNEFPILSGIWKREQDSENLSA